MKDCFFIVGSPRSGTTLLRHMLSGHAEIAVMPETHFAARYLRRRARFERGSGVAARQAARHRFLEDYCASEDFARLGIDEAAFRRAALAHPDNPWWPLRVAMEAFGECQQKARIGEKTPSHALYVEPLASAFPQARFIMLWRDPRAMASSLKQVEWSNRDCAEAAAIWRRYSKAMRHARARLPERCLPVRYEDLVSAPERTLGLICAFLGVPYDESLLNYPSRLGPGQASSEKLIGLPPQSGRIGAWRTALSAEEVSSVEVVCGRELSRMGYAAEAPLLERWATEARIGPSLRLRRLAKRVKRRAFFGENRNSWGGTGLP